MNEIKVIAKNGIFLLLGNVIGYSLQLFLIVYLARYLGVADFGIYAFAVSYSTLVTLFSDFGFNTLIVRELSRDKMIAEKYLWNIFVLKLIFSLIILAMVYISTKFLSLPSDSNLIIYIIALSTVFISYVTFFKSVFRAHQKMQYEFIITILEKILMILFVFPLVYLDYGLTNIVLAMLAVEIIIFMFSVRILSTRFLRLSNSLDLRITLSRKLIIEASPFVIASIFSIAYFQTDTLMLGLMKGNVEVGTYNAAYRLTMGMSFIPAAVIGCIFPVLSNCFMYSPNRIIIIYEKIFKLLLTMSIPLAIGGTLLANDIILSLYGDKFASSVGIFQILIWVSSLLFVYPIVGYVLVSINRQWIDTRITCAAAITNVLLNLLLIQKYSYYGAGLASLLTQLGVLCLEFNYLQKNGYEIKITKIILKPLLSGASMGFLVYGLNLININLILIIIIAIGFYITSLYILNAFDEDEKEIIKALLKNDKSIG